MKRRISIAVIALLACASPLRAEPSGGLDWSAWQRMPVLQDGRIMPLDSFARAKVKTICGDVRPEPGETRCADQCRNGRAFRRRNQASGERGQAAAIPGRGTPLLVDRRAGEVGRRAVSACRGRDLADRSSGGAAGGRRRQPAEVCLAQADSPLQEVRPDQGRDRNDPHGGPGEAETTRTLVLAGKGQEPRRRPGTVLPVEL